MGDSKFFGLRSFMESFLPAGMAGAFRDNVRVFLRDCTDQETTLTAGMMTWRTMLVDEVTGVVTPLFTVEENVRRSTDPFCNHCRSNGWAHHYVSKRRYHFIIPAEDEWDRASLPPRSLHRAGRYDDQQPCHLLHGLLHCNGFGHLLSINGFGSGASSFLPGHVLMDLFDRLCSALCAREITVEDFSRKNSMELRLLLAVAHGGLTWFGRWGYRFRMGSFGVTQEILHRSVEELACLDLDRLVFSAAAGRDTELSAIVLTYRRLRQYDSQCYVPSLSTACELLRYMLEVRRRSPPPELLVLNSNGSTLTASAATPRMVEIENKKGSNRFVRKKKNKCGGKVRDFSDVAAEMASRWPVARLRSTGQVLVEQLMEHGTMTRQALRDASREFVGDTGLLDFVIKSIGNCVVDGHVIRRCRNRDSRLLVFSLDEEFELTEESSGSSVGSEVIQASKPKAEVNVAVRACKSSMLPQWPRKTKVDIDLAIVYNAVIRARPEAAAAVLHGKHWSKSWGLRDEEDDRMRFLISWEPEHSGGGVENHSPPEVVVVLPHASVRELKEEAERALRDTCCALEGVKLNRLEGIAGEEWDPVLLCGVQSGAELLAVGVGEDLAGELRIEGGAEEWRVGCTCGARDDDGERMVACDACDVWQHTRCVGIEDGENVPAIFLCTQCSAALIAAGKLPRCLTCETKS